MLEKLLFNSKINNKIMKSLLNSGAIDFNTICRTCLQLKMSADFINISDIEPDLQKPFSEILQEITKLKIKLRDELPQQICIPCTQSIKNSYDFKCRAEDSEKFLLHYLSKNKTHLENNQNDENIKMVISEQPIKMLEPEIIHEETKILEILVKKETLNDVETDDENIYYGPIKDDDEDDAASNSDVTENKMVIDTISEEGRKNHELIMETNKLEQSMQTFIDGKHEIQDQEEIDSSPAIENTDQSESKPIVKQKRAYRKRGERSDTQQDYTCEVCQKVFKKKKLLSKHVLLHDPTRRFECEFCHKLFKHKDYLKSHTKRFHDKNYQPPPKVDGRQLCMICGKKVTCIKVHIRRHTGEKPYKCDLCDKAYPRLTDLKIHRRIHTGEKPYMCSTCGKSFRKQYKLKNHIRIHTGEKPHKCTYCDKAFIYPKDLKYHIRQHTGEKPFECGECGKRFIQKNVLTTHCKIKGHSPGNYKELFNN